MRTGYLTILAVILIISSISQSSYVIIKTVDYSDAKPITGKAATEGTIKFCISKGPPENLTIHNCTTKIREGATAACSITADSLDNANLTFYDEDFDDQLFFNTWSDGMITIRTYNHSPIDDPALYPFYREYIGNHTITIIAANHCWQETTTTHDIEVYDVNDAPVLLRDIPDKTIQLATPTILFDLDNYFLDPEYEAMTYNDSGPTGFVLHTNAGTGNVIATSTVCGEFENIYFYATDRKGLTTPSNDVKIKIECDDDDDSGSAGGSSGGGGGGSSCISDWQCTPWTKCAVNGTTTRTCVDQNACNPDYYIHTVEEECTYIPPLECEEIWECTEWNECQPSNTQSRECMEINGCGTEEFKPLTIKDCEYNPTCTDEIQNQGETGVDCGGPCLPCKTLEVPGSIREQSTIISSIALILILIILSLLIIYKYFHKQINAGLAKVFLSMIKKKKKRILLSDRDKEYLLEELVKLEKKITKKKLLKKTMDLSVICREYFSRIFKVSFTLTKEQLQEYIKILRIKEPLSDIFESFYDKIVLVETKSIKMKKKDVLILVEELREIIHQTSKFKDEDIGKEEIKEMEIDENDKVSMKIKKSIFNTYIAMHFDELDIAKNKYSEIIMLYEELPEEDKAEYYYDLERLFNEIKYLLSTHK